MANDPEIRAAMMQLHDAYVDALRAAADLAQDLPTDHILGQPFQSLTAALDAVRPPLRILSDRLIEPPDVRGELRRRLAEGLLKGRR